jgi:hypothetical protein
MKHTEDTKIRLKVVEVAANELKPNSKYLITIHPKWASAEYLDMLHEELNRLLGHDKFSVIVAEPGDIKIYSIPEAT